MTVEARQILDDYLRALEGELRDLAPSDRAEIILEVREHFEDARRELTDPPEAELRNIVERLGPPAEIAAEARIRFGVDRQSPVVEASSPAAQASARPGPLEILAVVGWVLWWPVGVLLTGLSPVWSRRDKVTALAIEVGFFAVVAGVGGTLSLIFNGGRSAGFAAHWVLFFFLLLVPFSFVGILGAAYLGWKLAHPGRRTWSREWMLAGRVVLVVVGGWLVWVLILSPLTLLLLKNSGA